MDGVRELYDPSRTNIRNRILHGNLLEIHSKRLEVHLPEIDPRNFGWLKLQQDPYHPENIGLHCLDCLERIDAEMGVLGVTSADATWVQSVTLTAEEIEFGHQVYCDFFGPNSEQWANTVSNYLNAVMPALKQLFTIGFLAWMRGQHELNPVTSTVMGFVYEALHRLTVHLMHADITGKVGGTVQKGHQQARSISHFQYRMLDARPDGLFSAQILDGLLQHVPVPDRPTARRVFTLAMKSRNALAHGAFAYANQHALDGVGHIFAKAVQTLVTAGLFHLTRERAYYGFRSDHPESHGWDIVDWYRAEEESLRRITAIANRMPWNNLAER